ncbi:MAG: hypothetical protein K6E97_02115 [Treponema sp.]|nr:hypothetical protein [Treponema sp.]
MKSRKNKLNQKLITLISLITASLVLIILMIFIISSKKNNKNVYIAFYGIEKEYSRVIEELFPKNDKVKYIVNVLEKGPVNYKTISKKYDLMFTWKGEVSDQLEGYAKDIPSKLNNFVPETIKNDKYLPLLLDNCELAYNKKAAEKFGGDLPIDFEGFTEYLSKTKDTVISPFICNGNDDKILSALIVNLIEKIGGIQAYKDFIDELKKGTDFNSLLSVKLGKKEITLNQILLTLDEWNKKGFLFNGWYNIKENDLKFFVEEKQTAVLFTYLSSHRNFNWKIMNEYEAYLLPPAKDIEETGIIAPVICGMLLSKKQSAKKILEELFTKQSQEFLSDNTKLAPVHLRARAYDKQAEDVRFWAAGTICGALPDVYNAAFQTKPEEFSIFCENIRNFLIR